MIYTLDSYMPHVVAGASFTQGWGGVSAVVGYDAVWEEWAGKVRVDVNATEQLSLFAMAGYKSGAGDVELEVLLVPLLVSLSMPTNYYGAGAATGLSGPVAPTPSTTSWPSTFSFPMTKPRPSAPSLVSTTPSFRAS